MARAFTVPSPSSTLENDPGGRGPSIRVHPAPSEGGGQWEVASPAHCACRGEGSSGSLGQTVSRLHPFLKELGVPGLAFSPQLPLFGPLRRWSTRGDGLQAAAGRLVPCPRVSSRLRHFPHPLLFSWGPGGAGPHSPRTRAPGPAAGARAGVAASPPAGEADAGARGAGPGLRLRSGGRDASLPPGCPQGTAETQADEREGCGAWRSRGGEKARLLLAS